MEVLNIDEWLLCSEKQFEVLGFHLTRLRDNAKFKISDYVICKNKIYYLSGTYNDQIHITLTSTDFVSCKANINDIEKYG